MKDKKTPNKTINEISLKTDIICAQVFTLQRKEIQVFLFKREVNKTKKKSTSDKSHSIEKKSLQTTDTNEVHICACKSMQTIE